MRVANFDYPLPSELIAKYPAQQRGTSRMMIVDRRSGAISHARFADFESLIGDGDLVVFNNARVIPARLLCDDPPGELLLTQRNAQGVWRCLARPARRFKLGRRVRFAHTSATVVGQGDLGVIFIRCDEEPDLEKHGHIPLPPYLRRKDESIDRERYQTVYASHPGAVAAPTAGLHFTEELVARLNKTFVTLYVGEGTFRDIKTEQVEDHIMHEESYEISHDSCADILAASRVLAIGTTVVRTLESALLSNGGRLRPGAGVTSLFIRPGFRFKITGALLTNFHLPKSTLLILVSAFAGTELMREAYAKAVEARYRFFSYGDCMLIL